METLADKLKRILKVQHVTVKLYGNPDAVYEVVLMKNNEILTTAKACATQTEAEEVSGILNEGLQKKVKALGFYYAVQTRRK